MYRRINELLGTKYKCDSDINWWYLSTYKTLSEDFIEEFFDKLNKKCISQCQYLSESFIKKHINLLDLEIISIYQVLSSDFISEYEDILPINLLVTYQILSEDYINYLYKNYLFSSTFDWPSLLYKQPFIPKKILEHYDINENTAPTILPILYQKTKERGWFLGYIDENFRNIKFNKCFKVFSHILPTKSYLQSQDKYVIKSKIYWSDIVKPTYTKNYFPVRLFKLL